MADDNARPGSASGTGGEQVDQTSCHATHPVRLIAIRRRHAKALDHYLDELDDEREEPNEGPWCSRWHDGPCDWWSTCTGMALGYPERIRAGREHPGRAAA